jgi:4-amino-4-deoxy-L-arabinose transferase-like glycosyltransferase
MFDITKIWKWITKNFNWKDLLFLIVILGLYFASRLTRLDQWPIFSDEGIYIRWAKVAWHDPNWRFISLTDGRQPLQTWGTIVFLKLFSENALFAGRMFAVSTGFVGLLGMITLTFYLWGKRAAKIAGLLFVFIPYFVFYDRIALIDSAVNAGFIWILFFSILLARTLRLDVALLMGFVGGFVLLAKSTSRMFMLLSVSAPILFISKKAKNFITQSVNYLILLTGVGIISLFFYNVQRLSPFFHYVEEKNATFVMTFAEFKQTPFMYFAHNIQIIPLYVAWEAGWLIVLFSLLGFWKLYKRDLRLFLYILAFVIGPFVAIAFFAKVLFPRYLIFYASILIITATYFFTTLKSRMQYILVGILLLTMSILSYPLIFNPTKASFPEVDRGQYIEGATAVWGAKDLMDLMKAKAKQKPVLVLAEGNFGLVGDVLDVYVHDGDQVEIKGLWPLGEKDLFDYQPELMKRDVYVVFSHREEFPAGWPIKLIKEYKKPGNKKSLYLFKLVNVSSEGVMAGNL